VPRLYAAMRGVDVGVKAAASASARSGRTRPGFEALLDAMKTSQVDAVICWHTDRLYPSMKDLERLIEIAEAARISIKTVNAVQTGLSSFSRICWSGRRTANLVLR
jgi:DNA invertase Pin-like site-specific DNA recombinase